MPLAKHLTLGFLLSLAALGGYYELATHVLDRNHWLTQFDATVADSLHANALQSPATKLFFRAVTELGSVQGLAALTLTVALVLLWWRHRLLAVVWLVAQAGGGVLNQVLKGIIARDRPAFSHDMTTAPGYSFPSGHSMASLIAYGMLAYLLLLSVPVRWLRYVLVTLLALLVLAIGFSRMYLGAHWFSDVLGGFCAGTIWLTFCITAIETVRRRRLRMQATAPPTTET